MDFKNTDFENMGFENMDEYEKDRIEKLVLEFIELDSEILLYKDTLIEKVKAINFGDEDAFETLIQLIETYYTNTESCIEAIEVHNIDFEIGKGVVNEDTTIKIKTHEDVEILLEEPWRSSALRKLWKTISSIEFRQMWDDGMTSLVIDVLEIVLLVTDEDGYVPVSFDNWLEEREDAFSPVA